MSLPYPGIIGFVYSFGAQFTAPLCYVKTCGQLSEIGSLSNYTRFPCILLLFLNQGFLVYVILYCPFIPIKGFVCNYSILATIQLWKISTNHPKLTRYHYSRFPQYCELWLVSFSFCPFKQGSVYFIILSHQALLSRDLFVIPVDTTMTNIHNSPKMNSCTSKAVISITQLHRGQYCINGASLQQLHQ